MTKELTADERAEAIQHLRDAVFHLASCWDALREVETITEGEVETDAIECVTGDVNEPVDALESDWNSDEFNELLNSVLAEVTQ